MPSKLDVMYGHVPLGNWCRGGGGTFSACRTFSPPLPLQDFFCWGRVPCTNFFLCVCFFLLPTWWSRVYFILSLRLRELSILFPFSPGKWIKVLARILWVADQVTTMGPKGLFLKCGLGAYHPWKWKLKCLWCVFHGFQAINLMYRLGLNNNVPFTLSKTEHRLKLSILNESVILG